MRRLWGRWKDFAQGAIANKGQPWDSKESDSTVHMLNTCYIANDPMPSAGVFIISLILSTTMRGR